MFLASFRNTGISRTNRLFIVLLALLGICVTVLVVVKPLILSIDSIAGLLAYKGTIETGQFNRIAGLLPENINQPYNTFVSWWSPGQWMVPGLFIYLLGIKTGVACIITTLFFAVSGMTGFYKVFSFYRFPQAIKWLSLLVIALSSTFYYSFIIYQGGEILSFGVFPWFVWYVMQQQRPTLKSIAITTILFLACFVAKTTLVIYCSAILSFKMAEPMMDAWIQTGRLRFISGNRFTYLVPLVLNVLVVYLFLNTAKAPTVINGFRVSMVDIFIPLSSPLGGLLIFQPAIIRLNKFLGFAEITDGLAPVFYILMLMTLVWTVYIWIRRKCVGYEYTKMILFLYAAVSVFFIYAYCMDTNIDYSFRHFKLVAYLFVPGIVTVWYRYIKPLYLHTAIVLLAIITAAVFVQLKNKWSSGRYLSVNYLYRNQDSFEYIDNLDEASYRKLLQLDKQYGNTQNGRKVVFFVDTNLDVLLDLQHTGIAGRNYDRGVKRVVYRNKGPLIVAAVSKKCLLAEPELLHTTFPDYGQAVLIDSTADYQYFTLDK